MLLELRRVPQSAAALAQRLRRTQTESQTYRQSNNNRCLECADNSLIGRAFGELSNQRTRIERGLTGDATAALTGPKCDDDHWSVSVRRPLNCSQRHWQQRPRLVAWLLDPARHSRRA